MAINPPQIAIPERHVRKQVLGNGTTFLYAPNPHNQIVAIRILSKLSSCNEPEAKAGMANLTMRMLSAGTESRSEDEIAVKLEENGAHFKAEAGKDTSAVDLLTTTHFLREDLETVLDLIDAPTFPEDKLARERELVRMSILEQEDSLLAFTMRVFRKHFFGGHPYAWSNLGLPESIGNINRNDLTTFADAAFAPSNLVVSVVGGPESGEIEKIVSERFESRPARPPAPSYLPGDARMNFSANTDVIEHRKSESEYLVMGYGGPSITDPESMPLRMIGAMLGGSMDSRLFREIRDKRGLCYQVGSSYTAQHSLSPLVIYVVTTPQNRAEAVRCAEAEIEKLKNETAPGDEIQRVKTYICGTYIMALESNMGQATRFASYEGCGLGWDYANRFPEYINLVSPDDIAAAANQYFTHRLLAITAPA